MILEVREWKNLDRDERKNIFSRSEIDIEAVRGSVSAIIDEVRSKGDTALLHFSKQFDHADLSDLGLRLSKEEIDLGASQVSEHVKSAIDYAIENVHSFHQHQKSQQMTVHELRPGLFAAEKVQAIESAGLYVPRGRGSFPSMLYMLAVPALIAGVERIVICTPPDSEGRVDPGCLYTAKVLGLQEIYRIGGAQAVAALAYGTESIAPVDKITGPGSMYVTAAKRMLYGQVDVGLPAGPSESILIADDQADPELCARDLLIEAEHGSDSCALLLCTNEEFAQRCARYAEQKIDALPDERKKFVSAVLGGGYGGIIVCESLDEAVEISNTFAPEHLELQVAEPFALLGKIQRAGEILIGPNVPFSCANYLTGPNAVLPTGGKARTYSAVSVRDFVTHSSVVWASKDAYHSMAKHTEILADYEGFASHANAVKDRNI